MKRVLFLLCLVVLAVPVTLAAPLCTDPIIPSQNVLAAGFSCELGPLLFQNFSASGTGFPPTWTPVIAIGPGAGGNMTGISGNRANLFFQTNFNSNQFAVRNVTFTFQVIGVVTGIDGWIGGTGQRSSTESACSDPSCAGTVYGSFVLNQSHTTDQIMFPESTNAWVRDVIVLSGSAGNRATMSEFSNSFYIPEPLTLVLVGTGLLGLGLLRRRLRG